MASSRTHALRTSLPVPPSPCMKSPSIEGGGWSRSLRGASVSPQATPRQNRNVKSNTDTLRRGVGGASRSPATPRASPMRGASVGYADINRKRTASSTPIESTIAASPERPHTGGNDGAHTRLSVGTRVSVVVDGQKELGTVRFLGTARFAPGRWVGVALAKPHGKNDGSLLGERYFRCESRHGVFVRPAMAEPFHDVSEPVGGGDEESADDTASENLDCKSQWAIAPSAFVSDGMQRKLSCSPQTGKAGATTRTADSKADNLSLGCGSSSASTCFSCASSSFCSSSSSSAPLDVGKLTGTEAPKDECEWGCSDSRIDDKSQADRNENSDVLFRRTSRDAIERRLVIAAEDHDVAELRSLLPEATKLGVLPANVANAQRVLHFEVEKEMRGELDSLFDRVSRLTDAITAADRQACELSNFAASDKWVAQISESLEKRLWSRLERKADETIRAAVRQEVAAACLSAFACRNGDDVGDSGSALSLFPCVAASHNDQIASDVSACASVTGNSAGGSPAESLPPRPAEGGLENVESEESLKRRSIVERCAGQANRRSRSCSFEIDGRLLPPQPKVVEVQPPPINGNIASRIEAAVASADVTALVELLDSCVAEQERGVKESDPAGLEGAFIGLLCDHDVTEAGMVLRGLQALIFDNRGVLTEHHGRRAISLGALPRLRRLKSSKSVAVQKQAGLLLAHLLALGPEISPGEGWVDGSGSLPLIMPRSSA
eukprot:TRINITY_DN48204_c0_g1_i1.p1 TRINITY_DN48204_c0_g1~~TRINITY_DN48204_c0_g1_i1.p1  ORF type:complete len:771 (-),score=128.17 TRINITY_DN48204_c0_g1_i1:111-2282(-)